MEKENEAMTRIRTHRVGSFTSGFCMIGFGILLLLHNLLDILDFAQILGLWPLILIGMGMELLKESIRQDSFVLY